MAEKLTPLSEFPLGAGLPEHINPEEFGVNESLLGTIASVSCLGDVTLDWHRGHAPQTNDIGVAGFAGDGTAFAVARGKATPQPLGKYNFTSPPSDSLPDMLCGHAPRGVRVSVDVPEIQDRLGRIGKLHDKPHWAKMLDGAVGEQFRAASREHLLKSKTSRLELIGGVSLMNLALLTELFTVPVSGSPLGIVAELTTDAGTITIGVHNVVKAVFETKYALKGEGDGFKNVCFSFFPGYHLDRYLGVKALTHTRRIIRPMPTK